MYSYESDLSIGGEWWIGRRRGKRHDSDSRDDEVPEKRPTIEEMEMTRSKKAALSETSLREDRYEDGQAEAMLDSPIPLTRDIAPSRETTPHHDNLAAPNEAEERDGVLKARVSGNGVCLHFSLYTFGDVTELMSSRSRCCMRLEYGNV